MVVQTSQEFYSKMRELGYDIPEQTAWIKVFLCPDYAARVTICDFERSKTVIRGTTNYTNEEWLETFNIINDGFIKEVEITSEMYGYVEANVKQYVKHKAK